MGLDPMHDEKTCHREICGLKSAMDEFSIKSGTIATSDDKASFETNINAVPVWKWLLDGHINHTK